MRYKIPPLDVVRQLWIVKNRCSKNKIHFTWEYKRNFVVAIIHILYPLILCTSFRPYHGPGVDSAPSENEYQEHFVGVKAAGAWGWQPHHLHVPNVMKSGSLNLLEPSGPRRACYGTPLPLPSPFVHFMPCLAQYSRWDFGIRMEFIDSDIDLVIFLFIYF